MKRKIYIIILCFSFIYPQNYENNQAKFRSLILPGWGEKILGESNKSNNFFIREAILWIVFMGGKKTSLWYKSDYNAFAELHADVNMSDKDYLFAINLGNYDSFELYNDIKERQRSISDKYNEGDGYEWEWDSSLNRLKFDKMRIRSATYSKIANFAIGGLILHRIVSFFNVLYLEKNNKVKLSSNLNLNSNSVELFISFSLDNL